ncbi:hypothetical protein ACILD6_02480 [Capnocytophaga canimorsus]|uniref:hypothetical protein n=1 Tax=Capnocytophaga canimorsus TaxID=28188 RepID=UPI0037D3CA98
MERITNNTEFYIWNDIGLISPKDLDFFCENISKTSRFDFNIEKTDLCSHLYLSEENRLSINFYNNGYIIFVEGEILNCIYFLKEFDKFFYINKFFYISPTQRLDEDTKFLYPRGIEAKEIALFLDKIFNNSNYSELFLKTERN